MRKTQPLSELRHIFVGITRWKREKSPWIRTRYIYFFQFPGREITKKKKKMTPGFKKIGPVFAWVSDAFPRLELVLVIWSLSIYVIGGPSLIGLNRALNLQELRNYCAIRSVELRFSCRNTSTSERRNRR